MSDADNKRLTDHMAGLWGGGSAHSSRKLVWLGAVNKTCKALTIEENDKNRKFTSSLNKSSVSKSRTRSIVNYPLVYGCPFDYPHVRNERSLLPKKFKGFIYVSLDTQAGFGLPDSEKDKLVDILGEMNDADLAVLLRSLG